MLNPSNGYLQTQTPGLNPSAFKEKAAGLPLTTRWEITPQLQLFGFSEVHIGEHYFFLGVAFHDEELFQLQLSMWSIWIGKLKA